MVNTQEILRSQLREDLVKLHRLIVRYAEGERSVKQERDQLVGAVDVKLLFLKSTTFDRP